jgi:CheY-like chemotaxis protein
MLKKLFFFIVDDDEVIKEQLTKLLTSAGHKVGSAQSSSEALTQIISQQPDCILCDLLLPGLDGLELFQNVRKANNIKQPIFIIITGKQYEYDRRRALNLGVQGYINKPFKLDTLLDEIEQIASDTMSVEFWGCRGTLPVAGKAATRYGGNTNCVTVCIAKNIFLYLMLAQELKYCPIIF